MMSNIKYLLLVFVELHHIFPISGVDSIEFVGCVGNFLRSYYKYSCMANVPCDETKEVTIEWFKNGVKLEVGNDIEKYKIMEPNLPFPCSKAMDFYLYDLQTEDAGIYRIELSSNEHSDSNTFIIHDAEACSSRHWCNINPCGSLNTCQSNPAAKCVMDRCSTNRCTARWYEGTQEVQCDSVNKYTN